MIILKKTTMLGLAAGVVSALSVVGVQAENYKEMVKVPAGEFISGCNKGDKGYCPEDARPKRKIYLDAFKIDKYMVTFARYNECKNSGQCTDLYMGAACNAGMSWNANHPVNCVDWNQAKAFCAFEGKRLPTEAEWEKAARGTDGRTYPWGEAKPSCKYAIMDQKVGGRKMGLGCGRGTTQPVGKKPAGASPYGAMDMAGNLYEWTADWYDPSYNVSRPKRNPKGPASGNFKALRSSTWTMRTAEGLSLNVRYGYAPLGQGYVVGFRCAKSM